MSTPVHSADAAQLVTRALTAIGGQDLGDFARGAVAGADLALIFNQMDRARGAEAHLRRVRADEGLSREAWLAASRFLHPVAAPGPAPGPNTGAAVAVGPVRQAFAAFGAAVAAAGEEPSLVLPSLTQALDGLPAALRARVDAALESDWDSEAERSLVAAVSAFGAREAAAHGALDARELRHLVAAVDLGLRVAKVGLRLSRGELSGAEAAADLVADRLAAHVAGVAGALVEEGAEMVGASLGALVENFVPLGGRGVQAGRVFGRAAGAQIRPHVEQGVKQVVKCMARVASRALREVASELRQVGAEVWGRVFG